MADQMSQEQAQWLFKEGATIVFLDVPAGTEFGIDYNSWTVGNKFKGVKMIPPGVHFVYYSAVGLDRQVAPRTGFMHNFHEREVLVKVWDKQAEDIRSEATNPEEQERIESNKQELDSFLGVYPYESYKKWVSLTNFISPKLAENLVPLNGKISAVTPLESVASSTRSRREAREELAARSATTENRVVDRTTTAMPNEGDEHDPRLPDLKPCAGTQIRFTAVPRRKFPDGARAVEITKYNMDHSYVLQCMLMSESFDGDDLAILGELQFSFICFLIGQVFDGFEQWKRLVNLLCNCLDAVGERPSLFINFISVLHFHIQEIPEDFFVDIVSRDNFLVGALSRFFENVEVSSAGGELKKRGRRFRSHLEKRFRWSFNSESDEFAPVLVI